MQEKDREMPTVSHQKQRLTMQRTFETNGKTFPTKVQQANLANMSRLCPFSVQELNSETHTAFGCHAWVGLTRLKDYSHLAYVPTLLKRPTEWPTR